MLFFSKLWFILLALLAAAAAALLLVIPRPAIHEISRAQAEALDRTQHNTHLLMRLESRRWLDAASHIARDGEVVEALDKVNDRRSTAAQVSPEVASRLRRLIEGVGAALQPELMVVTDADGKQIARLGPGEDRLKPGKHGIGGYPVVEAALRGFRADDTWSVDGKLYLIAASPIISPVRRRYIGALVLGQEVDASFADQLKRELGGTDLAFFLRGSMVASTVPKDDVKTSELNVLPRKYAERRDQIREDGRSVSMPIGEGDRAGTTIMAPLPGEAGAHDAFYAVISSKTPPTGLLGLVDQIKGKALGWDRFPWLLLGGGLLAVLIIGLALMFWEADAPTRSLLRRFTELGKGELARVEDKSFSGKFGSMARAVNAAMERAEKRGESGAPKNLSKILGSPPEPAAQPDLRVDPSFSSMPPLAPAGAGDAPEAVLGDSDVIDVGTAAPPPLEVQTSVSPPEADTASSDDYSLEMVGPGPDLEDAPTELQQEPAFPAPPAIPGAGEISLADADEPASAGSSAVSALSLDPELPSPVGGEDETIPAMPTSGDHTGSAYAPLPPLDEDSLPVPKQEEEQQQEQEERREASKPELELEPPAGAPEEELDPEEQELAEYFEQVYESFIAVKRQCGESVDNLTLERFQAKLKKNRASLVERYECKSVKFQVYIKDGKAAIKATPVKE